MGRDLTGRVIVITGASSGIGAATAVECARAGLDVLINARREQRLKEVAAHVEEQGRRAAIVAGSVDDPEMTGRLLDTAEESFGRVDAVFANAGYGQEAAMHEMSEDDLRRMFEVNFFAAASLLREAAQRLLAQKRPGHLLMCSSCLAKFSLPLHGAYSATKGAQSLYCAAMRAELAHAGIEVSSVHPITTETEFFESAAQRSGRSPDGRTLPEHSPRLFTQSPQRVARAVVRCLRRPQAEVWTSRTVRIVAGLMTMSPGFADWVMRRQMRRAERDVSPERRSAETAKQ